MKAPFQHHHPLLKIIEWLVVMLILSVSGIVIYGLLPTNPNSIHSLRALQVISQISTFLIPCFVMACLWKPCPLQWLGLYHTARRANYKHFIYIIVIMIVALPFNNLLLWLNQQLTLPGFLHPLEVWMQQKELQAQDLTILLLQANSLPQMVVNLCVLALLPALTEEIFFRGTLQNLLTREDNDNKKNSHAAVAIWATAIIFSAIHLQFYGFLPRLLLGAFFGYLFVWSRTLWLPILAHFTNNAIVVIFNYLADHSPSLNSSSFETMGTGRTCWVGILSGIITCISIYYLYHSLSLNANRKS